MDNIKHAIVIMFALNIIFIIIRITEIMIIIIIRRTIANRGKNGGKL